MRVYFALEDDRPLIASIVKKLQGAKDGAIIFLTLQERAVWDDVVVIDLPNLNPNARADAIIEEIKGAIS